MRKRRLCDAILFLFGQGVNARDADLDAGKNLELKRNAGFGQWGRVAGFAAGGADGGAV